MNNLQVINQQEILVKDFKIYGTLESPLFLAKDVAEVIENKNVSQMLNVVDEDEKALYTMYIPLEEIKTRGFLQNMVYMRY